MFNLVDNEIKYLTHGEWRDLDPRWSDNGERVVFSSDRSGSYDIYSCKINGDCQQLTKFRASSFTSHLVDDKLVFDAYGEGRRTTYVQDLPAPNLSNVSYRYSLVSEDISWEREWQWATIDSSSVEHEDYDSSLEPVQAVGGTSATAGHGASLGGEIYLSDKFENEVFIAGAGYNTYSYVPNHNSFAASAQYINRSGVWQWGTALYSRLGPRIDGPHRHLFNAYEIGTTLFASRPLSKYRRFETWGGLSYLDQEHLAGWSYPTDFTHAEDSLNFGAKGFLANFGGAYVKDNTLWTLSGPIDGTRYRVQLDITPNISALTSSNSDKIFEDVPLGRPVNTSYTENESSSPLFSYTASVDWRNYFRIGKFGTYGVRGFAYYSGGEVPMRRSIGKMGGMASFYPWYTPYGSRIWMVNQRLTVPLIEGMAISSPVLGDLTLFGIQASVFADFSQAWLEDNSNRGPVWGDYGVGVRIPMLIPGLMLRLDWGKIFTMGQNFKIPGERQGMQFGWWIGYEF